MEIGQASLPARGSCVIRFFGQFVGHVHIVVSLWPLEAASQLQDQCSMMPDLWQEKSEALSPFVC